jgi:hypothetical protein
MAKRATFLGWIATSYLAASYIVAGELVLWYLLVGNPLPHGIAVMLLPAAIFAPIFAPYLLYLAATTFDLFFIGHALLFIVVIAALLYLWRKAGADRVQSTTAQGEPPNSAVEGDAIVPALRASARAPHRER